MVLLSVVLALDEITKLVKDYGDLEDLAEHRLKRIEMLEVTLTKERTSKVCAKRELAEAKTKLEVIETQQEIDNQHYLEVVEKIEEFKGKVKEAKSKIKLVEEELAIAKVDMVNIEAAKKSIAKEKEGLQTQLSEKKN